MTRAALAIAVLLMPAATLSAQAPGGAAVETMPSTAPTTAPAKSVFLGDGRIELAAPAGWRELPTKDATRTPSFAGDALSAVVMVELLPPDAAASADISPATVRRIRQLREQSGATVIMPATSERDPRFAMRIREVYRTQQGVTEQLRLWRNVGGRIVMATMVVVSDDEATVGSARQAAEDMLLSARATRPPPRSRGR
jgi:hypothetical protein